MTSPWISAFFNQGKKDWQISDKHSRKQKRTKCWQDKNKNKIKSDAKVEVSHVSFCSPAKAVQLYIFQIFAAAQQQPLTETFYLKDLALCVGNLALKNSSKFWRCLFRKISNQWKLGGRKKTQGACLMKYEDICCFISIFSWTSTELRHWEAILNTHGVQKCSKNISRCINTHQILTRISSVFRFVLWSNLPAVPPVL